MEDRLSAVPSPDILDVLNPRDAAGPAVEDADRSLSYPALAISVRTLAGALSRRGVAAGDRVVVSMPNSVGAVQMYLACALVGAIWVGINPGAPRAEQGRQCALVDPRVVVVDKSPGPSFPHRRVVSFAELAADEANIVEMAPPPLSQPCAIGFSSGTTGTPKALVHSRAGVSLVAAVLADAQLRPDDRVGVILPMSIHNLIVVAALPALLAGVTCVPIGRMNAAGVASACTELKLTKLNALVPTTVYDLVHDPEISGDALATLRVAGTGAAGLSEHLRSEFEEKFRVRLTGSYGMTEAPGVVTIESPDDPHLAGASGQSLPHLRVYACNERRQRLPARATGELVVAARADGPWAGRYRPAMGHWSATGLVPRSATDTSLMTGDRGWVDHDGTVYVTGREADVIIRGGVNVNAAEIEAILTDLPDVRDVAVIGAPDQRLGQRIVAFVEPTAGTTLDPIRIRQQSRKELSHTKSPDVVIIGPLPRNAMGKVVRSRLVIETDS